MFKKTLLAWAPIFACVACVNLSCHGQMGTTEESQESRRQILPFFELADSADRDAEYAIVAAAEITRESAWPDRPLTSTTLPHGYIVTFGIGAVLYGPESLVGEVFTVSADGMHINPAAPAMTDLRDHSEFGVFAVRKDPDNGLQSIAMGENCLRLPVMSTTHFGAVGRHSDAASVVNLCLVADKLRAKIRQEPERTIEMLASASISPDGLVSSWATHWLSTYEGDAASSALIDVCESSVVAPEAQAIADEVLLSRQPELWRESQTRKEMFTRWILLDSTRFEALRALYLGKLVREWSTRGYDPEVLSRQLEELKEVNYFSTENIERRLKVFSGVRGGSE